MNKTKFVLDSWAILAWLENEKGADRVEFLLLHARNNNVQLYLNLMNLGEVYYISIRKKGADFAGDIIKKMHDLPIEIVEPINEDMVLKASAIKAQYSIAYADAFAAATASLKAAIIVTGDPEFKLLEHDFDIEWLV